MTAPKILRASDVCTYTGLSRTTMYRLIRQRQFPAPIRLTTRTSGWMSDEVNAWLGQRMAESRLTPVATSPERQR
jgi:prophage regulatory protein